MEFVPYTLNSSCASFVLNKSRNGIIVHNCLDKLVVSVAVYIVYFMLVLHTCDVYIQGRGACNEQIMLYDGEFNSITL